jgi:diguanylate cyclase (GGDEF)-like protein
MLRAFNCITVEHDLRLVLLAGAVCFAGCWIVIRMFLRARASEGLMRSGWLVMTAVAAGTSIWTTHFVAMLAFQPNLSSSFDPVLTVASLLIAVGGCLAGFAIASWRALPLSAEIGGGFVGLGIGAMHYTGMSAYSVSGRMEWDMAYVTVSVIAGILLGSLALNRAVRPVAPYWKYVAVTIFTLGICILHFTGMAAVTIVPDSEYFVPPSGISSGMLALCVVAASLLIVSTGFSSYLVDQRSREDSQRHIHHLAFHDSLTGLPNRVSFNGRLAADIARCEATGGRLAVLSMDLNRFKDVNDVFGHGAGDRLLMQAAQRMTKCLRDGEFLARFGGDEFIAIQIASDQPDSAGEFAERLSRLFEEPFAIDSSELHVGASIGIAIYPNNGVSSAHLLANADVAMYRAKSHGQGAVCFFEPDMDDAIRLRRALSHELKTALEKNEFELHYQVQKKVDTDEICGFEALLRWKHGTRGLIGPSDFIPLAEETGLIIPIGEWVLRTACSAAASWETPYKIAVNLSPVQFRQAHLPAIIHQILMDTGLSPTRLEVEITESTLIENLDRTLHILRQIKALGVTIAMDDFGTGYSSLSTLHAFPFDKIKLDRSFVNKVRTENQAAAIVRAVLSLGKSLHIPVLAEGVETQAHLDFLRHEQCDEVQGFLMGHPVPHDRIKALVTIDHPAAASGTPATLKIAS